LGGQYRRQSQQARNRSLKQELPHMVFCLHMSYSSFSLIWPGLSVVTGWFKGNQQATASMRHRHRVGIWHRREHFSVGAKM
jgi:hypothetical protein